MYRIRLTGKKKPKKKGKTLMDDSKKPEMGQKPFSPLNPEDTKMVKDQLGTDLGKSLLNALAPLSRTDVNPNNLNITYDSTCNAIDISIILVDRNMPLWNNLQRVMWQNRMAWRYHAPGPDLILIVRWFLPYEFPKITTSDPGTEQKPQPILKNIP